MLLQSAQTRVLSSSLYEAALVLDNVHCWLVAGARSPNTAIGSLRSCGFEQSLPSVATCDSPLG
jgi:hypothetical protein